MIQNTRELLANGHIEPAGARMDGELVYRYTQAGLAAFYERHAKAARGHAKAAREFARETFWDTFAMQCASIVVGALIVAWIVIALLDRLLP